MNRDANPRPAASALYESDEIGWDVDTLERLREDKPARLEAKRIRFSVLPQVR